MKCDGCYKEIKPKEGQQKVYFYRLIKDYFQQNGVLCGEFSGIFCSKKCVEKALISL